MEWHHDLAGVDRWFRFQYRLWWLQANLALGYVIVLFAIACLCAMTAGIVSLFSRSQPTATPPAALGEQHFDQPPAGLGKRHFDQPPAGGR